MDRISIEPHPLSGTLRIPPSKSMAHRYIIGASLSDQPVIIENLEASKDIEATLQVMEGLGVTFRKTPLPDGTFTLEVQGRGKDLSLVLNDFNCNESGSTLRFLIPLLLLTDGPCRIIGQGKLGERPLDIYYRIMEEQGISYGTETGHLPLELPAGRKTLQAGTFQVPGDVSSQFITGLLFALPLLEGDSLIEITTPLESRPYVDLTLKALRDFGIRVEQEGYRRFIIPGSQRYGGGRYTVEGDYSQLAFFAVAGALSDRPIRCLGLDKTSLQGDKVVVEILQEMGALIEEIEGGYVFHPSKTHGATIDIRECPDLVPALTVLAALSEGETRITGGARLKIKESNRLLSTSMELEKLGAKITVLEDSLTIQGVDTLAGGTVDSWNDHRVAMSLAVASQRCSGPLTLTGAGSVAKSYPGFWEDFKKLGGRYSE